MPLPYSHIDTLTTPIGNNIFAWEVRRDTHGGISSLTIPAMIDGTLDDVGIGTHIVFEEVDDGVLRSCIGLEQFVRMRYRDIPVTIVDNHNHVLYSWIEAIRDGVIQRGCELIHIDEHSDLWHNDHTLDLDRSIGDPVYAYEFVNYSCNVGNYIEPAIDAGLIGSMIRIENEYQIDAHMDHHPTKNSILNLDLDIFAPELDHISDTKKLTLIKNLIPRVGVITISTSPFFIDQDRALGYLREIFRESI